MVDFKNDVKTNPMKTKLDFVQAVESLVNPLLPYFSDGKALLKIANTGAHYFEKSAQMEGFARVIFGITPYLTAKSNSEYEEILLKGLISGTDKDNPEYWGTPNNYDQIFVEMCTIALALLITPEHTWYKLNDTQKDNLYNWLNNINKYDVPNNNWNLFRTTVNLAFEVLGLQYDKELNEKCLDKFEQWYVGDGFITDGNGGKIDYYNGFAIHFLRLIYYKFMKDKDVLRCERIKTDAIAFANEYKYWFDSRGSTIAYGRSLTYKFAVNSFFGALVFADIEAIPWAEMKYIISNNFRWWFNKPIFSRDGILEIGYAYPTLIISEDYNSPASSYWALTSFILLATEDTHPLWRADEKAPTLEEIHVQKQPGMLLQQMENGTHCVAFCAGQSGTEEFGGYKDKYSKFVYSSYFGFSVSRGNESLRTGAFDNTLALTQKGEEHYRTRVGNTLLNIDENRIISRWQPFFGVDVTTAIIPFGGWHIRVHKISSKIELEGYEGGFSLLSHERDDNREIKSENLVAYASYDYGTTAIVGLCGYCNQQLTALSSNTNVLFPRTILPQLKAEIKNGENVLISAVFGGINKDYCDKSLLELPNIKGDLVIVGNKSISLTKIFREMGIV